MDILKQEEKKFHYCKVVILIFRTKVESKDQSACTSQYLHMYASTTGSMIAEDLLKKNKPSMCPVL